MSAESTTGKQEPILNSDMSTFLKLLSIVQYCNSLEVIMESVMRPAPLKIHHPLDSNEKTDQQQRKTFLIYSHSLTDTFKITGNFISYHILFVLYLHFVFLQQNKEE